MLIGLSMLDSKIFMIKFSALMYLCHGKIYKLRFSSHRLVYFLPILVLGYKHDVAARRNYEVGARSSAGEHLVDIEGVTGSIPVVPTTLILLQKSFGSYRRHGSDLVFLSSELNPGKDVSLYFHPY